MQPLRRIRALLTPTVIAVLLVAMLAFRHPGSGLSPAGFNAFVAASARRGYPPGMLISLALWLVLSVYWEIAAKTASAASRSESRLSRGFHLALITLGQILVFLPVPGLRTRWLPHSTPLIVIGLAMQLAFSVFMIWARRTLGRHWSGAVTTKQDHELIRSGPYRLVRHPIYTGLMGIYLATVLVSGEVHGLVGFALLSLAYWRKIRMEEHYLGELFGPQYEAYRSATAALIPGVF